MTRFLPTAMVLILMTSTFYAGTVPSRHGWSVTDTTLSFQTLVERARSRGQD